MAVSTEWLVALSKQLNVLSVASALVPVAVGLLRRRYLTVAGRCLWACAVLGNLLFGVLSEYGRIVLRNNILFLRTEAWLEAVLLGAAYYYTFTGVRSRQVVLALLLTFTLGAIVETVWFMDWHEGNGPYLHVTQAVLLIGLILAYFERLLSHPAPVRLLREPMFVVSVGAVIYYAGTVFVYVLETYLRDDPDQIRMIFILEYGLRALALDGSLAAALWLDGRRPAAAPVDDEL